MTSSGGSSPTDPAPAPPRKRFSLTGRSAKIDPARHAVRGDLADVTLADRVFAPHYARSVVRRATESTTIRAAPDETAEARCMLAAGDVFHLLDQSGGWAWGCGEGEACVGYVPANLLTRP